MPVVIKADVLSDVYVLVPQRLRLFLISAEETLTRWKSKSAQQLAGERHPGASFADIPALSSV